MKSKTVELSSVGTVLIERSRRAKRISVSIRPFKGVRVAASIVDMALPINRGKHGIGVYNNGGVHIPKPY